MKTVMIEIFWDDLNKEAQDRISKALGDNEKRSSLLNDSNWDIFPMCSMEIEIEEDSV